MIRTDDAQSLLRASGSLHLMAYHTVVALMKHQALVLDMDEKRAWLG